MKKAFFVLLIVSSQMSFAENRPMSVKERLRLSMWYEGVGAQKLKKHKSVKSTQPLPEELARPLSRI